MMNPVLASILATVLCAPASAADLDELLPPRPEASASVEASAPKGPRMRDPEFQEKIAAVKAAEEKVHAVAPRLREGSETQRASARTEARKALGDLFDAKLALQEFELSRLEKRSAELKERISRKKLSREKAIDERLAKMGGDDDWE